MTAVSIIANYPLTTLGTVLAIIVYFALGVVVGRARATYGVAAPAMSGHIEFEKRSRVQINTLEQIVMFLPLLWLATGALGDRGAAALALVWALGRILYARGYYADPAKRSFGYLLTLLPTAVALVAAVIGAVGAL